MMNGVLGAILPLAIAVTISAVPIIAEILLLCTKKPVPNAAAYLAGFIIGGVGGVLAILVAAARGAAPIEVRQFGCPFYAATGRASVAGAGSCW